MESVDVRRFSARSALRGWRPEFEVRPVKVFTHATLARITQGMPFAIHRGEAASHDTAHPEVPRVGKYYMPLNAEDLGLRCGELCVGQQTFFFQGTQALNL